MWPFFSSHFVVVYTNTKHLNVIFKADALSEMLELTILVEYLPE